MLLLLLQEKMKPEMMMSMNGRINSNFLLSVFKRNAIKIIIKNPLRVLNPERVE